MMTELYRSEDAQQILQIAIARQAEAGELSREQLFEIAAELNISSLDLQAAEQEWLQRRGELEDRQLFTRLRQHRFKRRLVRYAVINGVLLVLSTISPLSITFAVSIALLWGIGVALDAWRTYLMSNEELEEAFQSWQQRRQLKASFSTIVNRFNRWILG
ncbi:MAG: hypothetical protein Kow00121_36600 [Elainellaceae cyanobacterium]